MKFKIVPDNHAIWQPKNPEKFHAFIHINGNLEFIMNYGTHYDTHFSICSNRNTRGDILGLHEGMLSYIEKVLDEKWATFTDKEFWEWESFVVIASRMCDCAYDAYWEYYSQHEKEMCEFENVVKKMWEQEDNLEESSPYGNDLEDFDERSNN